MNNESKEQSKEKKNFRLNNLFKVLKKSWSQLGYKTLLVFFILVFLASVMYLVSPPIPPYVQNFEKGDICSADIVSPIEFKFEDKEATRAKAAERAAETLPVYREMTDTLVSMQQNVDEIFRIASQIRRSDEYSTNEDKVAVLAEKLPFTFSQQSLSALLLYTSWELLIETIKRDLAEVAEGGIVANSEEAHRLQKYADKGIYIIDSKGNEKRRLDVYSIVDLDNAREKYFAAISRDFPKAEDVHVRILAQDIGAQLLRPTLLFDEEITNQRRKKAIENTAPVMLEVQRNERIVAAHTPINKESLLKLKKLSELRSTSGSLIHLSTGLLALVPFIAFIAFLHRFHHKYLTDIKFLISVAVLTLLILFLTSGIWRISNLREEFSVIPYVIPTAAVGILVTLLAEGTVAIFLIMAISFYIGMITEWNYQYMTVSLWTGILPIFYVAGLRKRNDLYKALLVTIFVALVMVFGFYVFDNATRLDLQQNWLTLFHSCGWAFVNGLLSFAFVSVLLPIFEDVLGMTTHIKILETGLKSPILKRLEEVAPGTYQHCQVVANLAESSAEAVGADSLLARVASLYHDIGKIKKPSYYTENQTTEVDRKKHLRLAPSLSCSIIRGHVKEGVELAKEYRLPGVIRDIIAQHHGTSLMTYFYDKAKNEDRHALVKEDDYRYPGPKPQTVESAIVMLADAVEATMRSYSELKEGEVKQLVRKIVNEKLMDDQLDECDLTLKDLHIISEALVKSIVSSMHRRISYPTITPISSEGGKSLNKNKVSKEKVLDTIGGELIAAEIAAENKDQEDYESSDS